MAVFTSQGARVDSMSMALAVRNPINVTFDKLAGRLLILDSESWQLSVTRTNGDGDLEPDVLYNIDVSQLALNDPQGITTDQAGRLYILDGSPPRIVEAGFLGDHGIILRSVSHLAPHFGSDFQGIAFDPKSGHIFIAERRSLKLLELTTDGELVAALDLSAALVGRPQSLTFAPSGDTTDDASELSLYVVETKNKGYEEKFSTTSSAKVQITELSLSPIPAPLTAAPSVTAKVVRTIHTYTFTPPSPDPCGLTYHPPTNSLWITDCEVEEMAIYEGANVFEINLGGTLLRTAKTSFSDEPTGIAYNPANGHLFISDDHQLRINELNSGNDGIPFTADDTMTYFSVSRAGSSDPEGVAYDSWRGILYWADGVNNEVYKADPGANGIFDGISPAGDDQVTSFDTASLGVTDPEGICFNTDNGNLFIVGLHESVIAETDVNGTLLRIINASATLAKKPAGLGYAPSSVASGTMNLYMADRGIDNDAQPDENDGEVYELGFSVLTTANHPPEVDAGPDQTISLTSSVSLDGTVTDDGLPSNPGTVTTTWQQVEGPGTATFDDAEDVDTTVSFSSAGIYVLLLSATDGELSSSDSVTVTVETTDGLIPVNIRVAASTDDAEEGSDGSVDLWSSDLELVDDGGIQTIGLRFNNVTIPKNATIANASIQFKVDEASSGATILSVQGQASDHAATFSATASSISSRPRTAAAVSWSPTAWTSVGAAGAAQQTIDLAPVIQEIVSRPGWSNGSSLAIIITGTGKRVAESYNGDKAGAPLLHIAYSLTLVSAHDVAVTSMTAPTPVTVGTTQTVTVTVANQGTFVETFEVSLADTLGATVGVPQTVTDLAAGGSKALSFSWTPTGTGTHTLTATAATVSGETDTADNVRTAASVVNPVPVHDVAVTSMTAPTPVTVGTTQTVTVTVANQGTLAETFAVSLADSLGATVGAPQTVTDLAAGGSKALSFSWTPTGTGTHTLTATAATVSGETDTADNVRTAASVVNPVPVHDVAVTSVTAPTPVMVSQAQTVAVIVANQGTLAETFAVSLADSLGATVGAPQTVTDLAAGGSQSLSFGWTPTEAGTHTLTATAATVTGEVDTIDNIGTATSLVNSVPAHDVAVMLVTAPTPVTVNTAQTVTVTVANQGTFVETFAVSLADSLGATVGVPQTVTDVAAGGSLSLSFDWTPTETGTHTLTATAATVSGEIDMADNVGTATVESAYGFIPLDIRVAASTDDAEEGSSGSVDRYSSDLELVDDGGIQTVGLRFNNVSIPKGATVANAYIQFKVDETSSGATTLNIQGQAADNAATFLSSAFGISSRVRTTAAVAWSPEAWPTVGAAGTAQRTTDLAPVIQEIVGRAGWLNGSSLVMIITGTGKRVAESYNGDKAGAPLLHVEYISSVEPAHDVAVTAVTAPTPVTVGTMQTVTVTIANQGTFVETFEASLADSLGATVGAPQTVTDLAAGGSKSLSFDWTPTETGTHALTVTAATVSGEIDTADNVGTTTAEGTSGLISLDIRVAASTDDAEEAASGSVDLYSTDLELVDEGGIQTIGMRFNNVSIPEGATIANAYIQFKVDETSSGATTLNIQGQAADNAVILSSTAFNISSRARTTAAVAWSPAAWPTVGVAGTAQRTTDLAPVLQEIVGRPGWMNGSSLVIIITGTGKRVAESYNGDKAGAPLLHVEYALAPSP